MCELGIVFLLEQRYIVNSDLRGDIKEMGLYLDENQLLTDGQITYESIDYIFTYSKGLIYDVENEDGTVTTINRGAEPVVISGYLLHLEGNMAGTSQYVQDEDDICIAGTTSDKKYYTVSYDSIYGMIKSQGLE